MARLKEIRIVEYRLGLSRMLVFKESVDSTSNLGTDERIAVSLGVRSKQDPIALEIMHAANTLMMNHWPIMVFQVVHLPNGIHTLNSEF